MVKWMKLLFQYLDRFYCEMHSCTKLNDQGFKIFKEVVFHPLCEPTTKAIIDEISKQRNGEQMVELELLKGTINIYLHLCSGKLAQDGFLPRNNLDKAILQQTETFYSQKSQEIMQTTSLIDYLKIADRFYKEEKTRVENLFTWEVGQEVLKVFRREMLIKP